MIDLNEIPELASNHPIDAVNLKVAPISSPDRVNKSKQSDYGVLSPASKDCDEALTITAERSAELLASRSSLSSTLTFESSLARQLSKTSLGHEEDNVEKGGEGVLTSNLVQEKEQQEQLQSQEDSKESADLCISAHGAVYQFISANTITSQNGVGCAEASTSGKQEVLFDNWQDDHRPSCFFACKKTMESQNHDSHLKNDHGVGPSEVCPSSAAGSACLSLGGSFADGLAVCLSLGGSALNSKAHYAQNLTRAGSSLRRPEVLALALGCSDEQPSSSSKRNTELYPFWHGKLRTDGPLLTPVDAYCLGVMKPDSRLKKLPAVLSSQKFLKLEEFMKILHNGVMEPLTRFKPSLEASLEEVNRFNLMVEALSHGSGLSHSSMLGLDLGRKKAGTDGTFPYSAALISWEEDFNYSEDAKLYLISSQCFQELVKNGQTSPSLGASEEMDVLDSESLYGIFCSSSPGHSQDTAISRPAVDQDVGRIKIATSGRSLDTSLSTACMLGERGKDTVCSSSPIRSRGSPCIKRHVGHSDDVTETRRLSSRDTILRSESEVLGRVSRRRLEKQASSIDNNIRDLGSRHLSKQNDDLYDDDIGIHAYQKLLSKQKEKSSGSFGRHSERLEWRSDRNKDTARWSKEDRDSMKDRVREHQRSSHYESERGSKSKTKEEYRSYDRVPSHKERDKSSRDKVTESLKVKLPEKDSSHSCAHKAVSPDQGSGKPSKKREREDYKESSASLKRSRELETTVQVVDRGQETCRDLKSKVSVEQMNQGDCLPQTHLEQSEKFLSIESKKDFLLLNNMAVNPLLGVRESDDTLEMKDKETLFLDEDLTKPLLIHANFDRIMETNQDSIDTPVDETEGVSEMDTDLNLLKVSLIPSWNGSLEDSLPSKTDREERMKASLEVLLDGPIDKETRTWLMSKQNSLYLHEEYGVDAEIICISSEVSKCDSGAKKTDGPDDALAGPDITKLNLGAKADLQNGPLQVRISMATSEACDAAEAKWFVEQAASIVKSVASRGVYIKCLWYEGPVQIHPGDGAPSVPVIVKRIKGEDGKNLERIQNETGVMIGVVLRKSGVSTSNEVEPMSRPRFIGLRLKCIRRRGLLEASKETEALLESVAEHFSKVLATHIATHIADLQESAAHYGEGGANQDPSLSLALSTKELLPNSPVKMEGHLFKSSSWSSSKADEASWVICGDKASKKLPDTFAHLEERKAISTLELGGASKPLYVSNLPEHMTSAKIKSIIECVLKEKLGASHELENVSDLVLDVKLKPDKCCAFVELVNDRLLRSSVKLYEEDKMAFHGLTVEEGFIPFSRTERQGSFSRGAARNRAGNARSSHVPKISEEDDSSRRQFRVADNESDSDFSQDAWYADNAVRTEYERPRPLYLTELMRNASSPAIKQLFENVITTYLGPSLVNSSSKQLILDVRYVPTRGCAFVDLATPELVEFMLDLHSQRPEVFMNMKMELGRKAVPFSAEDEGEKRPNLWNREGRHGYRFTTSGSFKKLEKRPSGAYMDYGEDSDKGDDMVRHVSRVKKQRSDPEKTIYADRLPESASEGMIKRIFERVLLQNLTREERDAIGEQLITEVRHVPSKYCAFVVFANEELTRLVLELYNQDEDIFECMRLKPHFHSRLEDLYKDDMQETDEVVRPPAASRERLVNSEIDDLRHREAQLQELRNSRLAVQRAISATAFKEVDRRRSVYVDRIPEDLNEASMTQLFEKVFRHKRHGYDGHMVSQVAYFRDKFDSSKLCAFVEIKTEEGTQELVDAYNANPDAFHEMRVRPGFKYST